MTDPMNTALLVLRVALGVVFVAHGAKHFVNRTKTMGWTASIGFRLPALQWGFMTFAEIGIGMALLAGFLTAPAAAGLVAMMLVAYVTVHRRAGFWITARPDEGYEYAAVLSAAAAALALTGPGDWSLDAVVGLDGRLDGWVGLAIVAGGVLAGAAQLALFYRPGQLSDGSAG